ncbi:MAG: carbohydrate porin [Planctomycetes bacterium]|nr:carbohydrate porin [Planctomycetota bacterium]
MADGKTKGSMAANPGLEQTPLHAGRAGRGKASAEPTRSIDNFTKPLWQWRHATGDWGGLRNRLNEGGITPEVIYTGEVFSNWHGGINTNDATEYLSNLDMTLTLDTEKLGLWPGGTFFVYGEQLTGRAITERHVGDLQFLSNLDAQPFTQVSEYWYEQSLFNNTLRIRAGKQDGNTSFAVVDHGLDFINSSFGLPPTIPMPTFPDPGLGIAFFLEPADWLWVGGGIYDGDSDGGQWGFSSAFDGEGGTFSVVEAALKPAFGKGGRLPGKYSFGFWHHSDDHFEKIAPTPAQDQPTPRIFTRNYGLYAGIDQVLFRESAYEADEQGLAVFGQFGWAPADRNEIAHYYGAGMTYTGLIPGRDADVFGIALAHARLSWRMKRIDGRTHETAMECFYKMQVTPYLTVQPDIQYILNPGGDGKDALVGGLRFAIAF